MASGGTSWQYYNNAQKYPQMPPPNPQAAFVAAGGDMQDMHLKMSKKIAQLTKVIYALNTKNDEHEAALLGMKEAHEEETQQLLAETAAKIQHYRLKIGNELDLRRRLQNLEEIINASEREKRQAMIEFESFKRLVEEREMRLESDHALKVMSLTKDLMDSKFEFEQRIREFHNLRSEIRNEGGVELEKLSNDHRKELERLHSIIDGKGSKFNSEKRELIEIHNKQLQEMEHEISNLKHEFKKAEEDHENKMNKAKSFYERELAAARFQVTSTDEELAKRWQTREAELRQEASRLESTLKNKLSKVEDELRIQNDEVDDLRKKLNDTSSQLANSEAANADFQSCLSKLEKEYSNAADQAQYLREELSTAQTRLENQENDILKKSSQIGVLEAAKLTHDATIQDLEKEVKSLKSRIEKLITERDSLQSNTSAQSQQLMEQLQSLGKRIETVTEEKSALQHQFTKNLEQLKQSHANEMKQLTEQFDSERQATERNHHALVESMKIEAQNAMDGMLREMQDRLRKEATELLEEKKEAVSKIEAEKKELREKLHSTQNELSRMEELVQRHEDGLGDASSHIKGLNSRIGELQRELDMAGGRLRTSEASMSDLRKEMEQNKITHEHDVNAMERDHRNQTERLSSQLNSKWQDQLRSELGDLQTRLTTQHTQDKRAALEQLQSQKDRELEAARTGWQEQIKQLTVMISELKTALEQQQRDHDRTLAEEKAAAAQNERSLRQAANDAASEYSSKVSQLENAHRSEIATIEQKKEQEMRASESRLMSQHREEQQAQLQAQRITLETMREKLNHEHEEEMLRKEQANLQEMEDLRSEITHQHASVMDDMIRQNEHKLMTARSELERALDATRRQEADYTRKVTGLEEDLSQKTVVLNNLQQKVAEQNDAIVSLNKEVDCKGQEILRIRSEANTDLKRREDELTRKFQREQDKAEAENLRQKQALVGEFNRTSQALKDKISSINIALREAEERFERRESRPEDLRTIKELKHLLHNKEVQMQKLIDDKKYYQMELVNRETNFNKVFSASPNVGVLNPLNAQKKKNDKNAHGRFTSQFVNVPNLSSLETALPAPNRLGPIRNGSSSPSSSTSSYSKSLQPTPPPHPKKFIRIDSKKLLEQYEPAPSIQDSPLVINEEFFPPTSSLAKYQLDDFEGSLQEFDKECEFIESHSISSSCQSLNRLDGYEETQHPNKKGNRSRAVVTRSNTLPTSYITTRSRSANFSGNDDNDTDEDYYPDLEDVINDTWTKKEARQKRFQSSFSASVPNYYLKTSPSRDDYAKSRFSKSKCASKTT